MDAMIEISNFQRLICLLLDLEKKKSEVPWKYEARDNRDVFGSY